MSQSQHTLGELMDRNMALVRTKVIRCFGFYGKHDYQPRYDEVIDEKVLAMLIDLVMTTRHRDIERPMYVRQVYIQDVCVRCGDVVERPETVNSES